MKNGYTSGSLASFLPLEQSLFPLDQKKVFGRQAPLEVEIGFGMGEYLARIAAEAPGKDFLGFEQCGKRMIRTLSRIHERGLANVRLMRMDVVWALRFLMTPRSLARVHCLFPCPWPKKRHAKNRLFSADVLRLINSRLADGGVLYIVTDHRPYSEWIAGNVPASGFDMSRALIPAKFGTKFERKWSEAGQSGFYEMVLRKTEHQDVPWGGCDMKTFLVEKADLAKVRVEDIRGPLTVKFGEFLYDPRIPKAMVDAVVSEDGRAQHVWIVVSRTSKGWRVGPASGAVVLPTQGVQCAIQQVADAVGAAAA